MTRSILQAYLCVFKKISIFKNICGILLIRLELGLSVRTDFVFCKSESNPIESRKYKMGFMAAISGLCNPYRILLATVLPSNLKHT